MATWQDGPEYAPHERPQGFVAPDVATLERAAPRIGLPPAPPLPPTTWQAPQQPPLAQLRVKSLTTWRDPREEYAIGRDVLTGAPGVEAPERDPREPFQLEGRESFTDKSIADDPSPGDGVGTLGLGSSATGRMQGFPHATGPWNTAPAPFPQPGTPGWFAPAPARPTSRSLNFTAWSHAMTPLVWIPLLLGLVPILTSPVLFLTACIASTGIAVRQVRIRRIVGGSLAALSLVAAVGLVLDGQRFTSWWESMTITSAWLCGICLVFVGVEVLFGIREAGGSPVNSPSNTPADG